MSFLVLLWFFFFFEGKRLDQIIKYSNRTYEGELPLQKILASYCLTKIVDMDEDSIDNKLYF